MQWHLHCTRQLLLLSNMHENTEWAYVARWGVFLSISWGRYPGQHSLQLFLTVPGNVV